MPEVKDLMEEYGQYRRTGKYPEALISALETEYRHDDEDPEDLDSLLKDYDYLDEDLDEYIPSYDELYPKTKTKRKLEI